MAERREKRKRWVQRGKFSVEVEVEVIYLADDPSEPCLEPSTVRWLDEVAAKAMEGDLEYLQKAGRVFPSRSLEMQAYEQRIKRCCFHLERGMNHRFLEALRRDE